jgi:hypothetical protein
MLNIAERPRAIKATKAYFQELISNPPDGVPVLTCKQVGRIEVHTERCLYCAKQQHIHGVGGLDQGETHSHRAAHCTPPIQLHGQDLQRWKAIISRGYYLQLQQ